MNIRYLVLSGGGSKGFAYIGCLKYLLENGMKYSNLIEIAGTSIGSFVGLLICLGYTPEEMEEVSKTIDMNSIIKFSIRHFSQTYGFDNGHSMENMIKKIIKKKGLSDEITLKEFYEHCKIKFHIISTSVAEKKTIDLNIDTYPDMRLCTAVKISMSIPFIFGYTEVDGKLLVDGGLTLNFPLSVFKDCPHKEVLGLYLTNEHTEISSVYNIQTYITDTLYCLINQIENNQKEEIERNALDKEHQNVIIFNISKEFGLKLDMTDAEKHQLIDYGYSNTQAFFRSSTSEIH